MWLCGSAIANSISDIDNGFPACSAITCAIFNMLEHPASSRLQLVDLFGIAGLILLYAVIGKLTLDIFAANAGVALFFWPLSGVALATLLLGGRKYWPAVLLGAWASSLLANGTLWTAAGFSIGSTVEALFGYWLLSRSKDFAPELLRPRNFTRLVYVAAASALLGAGFSSATLFAAGGIALKDMPANFMHWWQGDLLGMVLFTPLLLVWRHPLKLEQYSQERSIESGLCLVLSFFAGQIIFLDWLHDFFAPLADSYWMFLFVAWSALRCDRRIAVLVLATTTIQAAMGTARGTGPFATDIAQIGLEAVWFYVVLLTVISFSLSLRGTERTRTERDLKREKQLSDDIINSLPGIFYMLDDQGRLVRWNTQYAAITGYSNSELQGKPALEIIAEKDRPLIQERIQQVLAGADAAAESGLLLRKDGQAIPYYFTGQRTLIGERTYLVGLGEDISERLAMRQAIDESEARYHLLFDSSVMQIFIMDRDGVILFANQSFVRFNGGKREALIGHSVYGFLPPEKVDFYRQRHDQAIEQAGGSAFEDCLQGPDGPRWISSQVEPARDSSGQVYGLQVAAFDITERKLAEQSLRHTEQLYQLLFEGTLSNTLVFDPAGIILMINKNNANQLGGTPEDFIGRSLFELMAPETVERYRARFDAVLRGVDIGENEDVFRLPDGLHWFASRLNPVVDVDGTVHGIQLTSLDITERKLAEEALRQNEELLKFALEGAGEAVWDWDLPADCIHTSKRWSEMLGYGPDETVPDWDALPHPEDLPVAAAYRQQLLESPEGSHETEVRVRCKDGRWKWILIRAMVVSREADGKPLRVVGTSSDITGRKHAELALRESEQRYRGLFENNKLRITILDADGTILMINESNARMLGGTTADFIGKSLRELDPERAEQNIQRYRQILQSGSTMDIEEAFPLADGLHWFSAHLQPLTNAEGKNYAVQVVAFDITERKQMEEALRKSEELWKFALEGSGDTVWDWDVPTETVNFNPRWKEALGYAPEDELCNWDELIHPEDFDTVQQGRQMLLEGETSLSSIEARVHCKDGSWKWFLGRCMVVSHDERGKPLRIVGINTDITPLKEHQRQLEHVAHYDVLTNLPNRLLLAFRLQHAMAQSTRRHQSLAVAYLDLDGFKAVNDMFGHNMGDELLVLVAQRMKSALREGDTLARIGGDEFIAILADLDQPQDCEPVLQRLLQAASAPILIDESRLSVSASIGVTLYPGDGADADQLIRHADQAMYQAKQAGKNRYHLFDIDSDAKVQRHLESIENIREALIRREFILHYQPKVNMRTGALVGAEALIRWQHPEQGLLSPAVFLPSIEVHELSVQVGEWVITTALSQMAEWQAHGLQVPVSVNIGAYHLQHGDFAQRLAALLAAHPAVDPGHLELEILESSAFEDLQKVGETMRACRQLGVRFALDDFGTGYASLTYLKRLPAELLKIDQSFVRDMLDDPDDLAIVEGVIGLAQAFQRRSIAEGVENAAHGELLLQLGCELGQGYGIAWPMEATALVDWAQRWQPDASWQRWDKHSLDRNNLAIVFAEVRHRHWLRGIAHALDGERETAPNLEHDSCPLAGWLASYGNTHYGLRAGYGEIVALHQRLHVLGHELADLQRQGKAQDGKTRLKSLHALQETLTIRLHALVLGERDT